MLRRLVLCTAVIVVSTLSGLAQSGDWKQLFDGKKLAGWEHVGPGKFVVEKGLMKPKGGMGLLWYSPEKFSNAVIRVVYMTEKQDSNSGVFIRIPEKPADEWDPNGPLRKPDHVSFSVDLSVYGEQLGAVLDGV